MPDIGISTPSPLLTPKSSSTLSEQINAATRPTHSELNRLIVARLPLALPPHSSNPTTYLTGLIHIASIYSTFEQLWQDILDAPHLPTTLNKPLSFDACDPETPLLIDASTSIPPFKHRPKVCTRTHSLLTHLRLPGLLRTGRIRADIRALASISDHEIDNRLEEFSREGPLADFLSHIKRSVETNPHVLLAYAWVLYMALFSGGRFLRLSLYAAGPVFWGQPPPIASPFAHRPNPFSNPSDQKPVSSETQLSSDRSRKASHSDNLNASTNAPPDRRKISRSEDSSSSIPQNPSQGLQFFNFLGVQDGEDIKLEFKNRIAEAEILLTSGEKDDIIQEAQDIFKFMLALVHVLDGICDTVGSKGDDSDSSDDSTGSVVKKSIPLNHDDSSTDSLGGSIKVNHGGIHALAISRSRDSVAINHDRLRKQHDHDHDVVLHKDVSPPGENLLKRSTTISFKGQDRKKSLAVVMEPLEKAVRWGPVETVYNRAYSTISTQVGGLGRGMRRVSSAKWEGRTVNGTTTVVPLVVFIIAFGTWWLLWVYGIWRR